MVQHIHSLDKLREKKARLLCSLNFLLKCRDNGIIPTFAKFVHFINTPAANNIKRKASLALVRERIRFTRRELDTVSKDLYYLHLKIVSSCSCLSWDWIDGVSWAKEDWAHRDSTRRQSAKFNRLATPRRKKLFLDDPW